MCLTQHAHPALQAWALLTVSSLTSDKTKSSIYIQSVPPEVWETGLDTLLPTFTCGCSYAHEICQAFLPFFCGEKERPVDIYSRLQTIMAPGSLPGAKWLLEQKQLLLWPSGNLSVRRMAGRHGEKTDHTAWPSHCGPLEKMEGRAPGAGGSTNDSASRSQPRGDGLPMVLWLTRAKWSVVRFLGVYEDGWFNGHLLPRRGK